jgi:two-component system, chemotaxis family, CheB/CheR fusion protein
MSNNPGTTDGNGRPAESDSDTPSRVVGIGASAGGLEAVSELLRHLPNNTGMAFVFIQHLEPRQTSRLTEILSRITDMPAEVAADQLRMKRNHIYVMPPGLDITVLQLFIESNQLFIRRLQFFLSSL